MGLFPATSGDYQLAIDTDNNALHFGVGPGAKPSIRPFPRWARWGGDVNERASRDSVSNLQIADWSQAPRAFRIHASPDAAFQKAAHLQRQGELADPE
jgi:hypothetical protein